MRTLLKALAILVTLWLYAVVRSAGAATLEDQIQSTAIHLVTLNSECSGTAISPTVILTARHCMDIPFSYVEIGGPDRVCKHFGKNALSKTQDLALIRVIGCGALPVASIAASPMDRGDTFTLIGLSDTLPWALARGFIMSAVPTQISCEKKLFNDIALSCQGCDEGDSGSGVFNTKGELAGVFVAASKNNVRGYMVPLVDVKAFLQEQHI